MKRRKHEDAAYLATMTIARRMLRGNLITPAEYEELEKQMKEKYHPLLGAFLWEPEVEGA